MKICTKCSEEKDESKDFFFNKSQGSLYAHCKKCHGLLGVRWKAENRDRYLSAVRKSHDTDEYRKYHKEWFRKNRDRLLTGLRERRAAGELAEREKRAKAKYRSTKKGKEKEAEWTKDNPEKIREIVKKYREAHPYIPKGRIIRGRDPVLLKMNRWRSRSIKRARMRASVREKISPEDIAGLLDKQGRKCANCAISLKAYHIDHYMPIALGGSHTIGNLDLLCASCNHKKNKTHPHEWERRNGRDPRLDREPSIAPVVRPGCEIARRSPNKKK